MMDPQLSLVYGEWGSATKVIIHSLLFGSIQLFIQSSEQFAFKC